MDRYLVFKTRDELIRIKIEQILYFEAERNYTKLILTNGIQFIFAVNIGKIEEILENQIPNYSSVLLRVGKSFIINKNHVMQISLPKTKLLFAGAEGKVKELNLPKEPLKILKETLEGELSKNDGK
ncbi:MAG: LytTR family transcriptional regulator [Dysgonamonadaceae bacterium]|jgi:DNA-binding LytR/AlgR family response regulator|nr:LytTR family transcriptional regulator [Dysgonamonadaceae bacterium]